MAKEKEEEQELDDDENKPNQEVFLEQKERDPDEAVFAEQAIHHYANDVLDLFSDQVEAAMSEVESFIMSQTQRDDLNGGYFLETLGQAAVEKAVNAFGGADSPIGRSIFSTVSGAVDAAIRGCDAQAFVKDLGTALRDCSWQVRDNLDSILSNEWDELRDLAYEGETGFIPALHAYGLPPIDFDKGELSSPLIDVSQQFLDALPKQKEESIEQDQIAEFEEQEAKMEEPEVQNLVMEEEEKKEAIM